MPEVVYLLCALTSAVCGALLFRSFRRQGLRLLLWMALCFVGLTLSNVLLYLDHRASPPHGTPQAKWVSGRRGGSR